MKTDKKEVEKESINAKIDSIAIKEESTPKTVVDIIENAKISSDTIPPNQKTNTAVHLIPDFHIVKDKETLYQIAYKYQLEVPDIRRWNGIIKDEIRIGQKLIVSESQQITPDNKSNTHTVVRGDTLFSIARRYGMTVRELKDLNNLIDNTISVDQVLFIK